jgi:3-deoxy-D-manno-octulosonic-acid transferase
MFAIYSLLFTLGFVALLPRFLYDAFRRGKYVSGFSERLGNLTPLPTNQHPTIWLHCVSVGETQAARPLIRRLEEQFPQHRIVVSTITLTGQRLARDVFKKNAAKVIYFPFDWAFTTGRSLSRINPSVVLLMETEIWPNFIRSCKRRGIPVIIVNGRLSERSFRRYRLVRPFISRVLSMVDLAVMQSTDDAERIQELGMNTSKVFNSGNLKFDVDTRSITGATTSELQNLLSSSTRPLLVAASTHSPEEKILIEAFAQLLKTSGLKPRLLIAPRHPERFAEVTALMAASGLTFVRRTKPAAIEVDADLILLDTIGELPAVYPRASVVFVGGSISKNGGHNILEPASVGSCIVTGAHTFNFAAIVREFVEQDAIIQLSPLSESDALLELADTFRKLLTQPALCDQLGQRSHAVVQQNIGATERTIEFIGPLLKQVGRPPFGESPLTSSQVRPA